MLTPAITRVLYVLGAIAILIYTIILTANVMSGWNGSTGKGLLAILAGIGAELVWRVLCESLIIAFAIHAELVRQNDDREQQQKTE
jgi:hypothetical protein